MKPTTTITLVIFFFSLFTFQSSAQSCLPEGITFSTQAQIDSFQVNYPGCTEIEGDVFIGDTVGTDITNLNGLSVLTSIQGDLVIGGNDTLASLTGLEGLLSIGGDLYIGKYYINTNGWLFFFINPSLTSLESLSNLTSVGGSITIYRNNSLKSLTGLEGLSPILGDLEISSNNSLTSLTGLEGLSIIEGSLSIEANQSLTSLTGLEGLTTIDSTLTVFSHDSLTSLTGLEGLSIIGGSLSIGFNQSLTNLTGLEDLTSIGNDFGIFGNEALNNLTGMENLISIGGDLNIGNLIYGGNEALTSLTGLENLTSIGGGLEIIDNPVLTSLMGMNNLSPDSITNLSISYNSTLSVCQEQWLCDYLLNPNGEVNIFNNASGCNSVIDVADGCGDVLPCLPYGNYYFLHQSDIDEFQSTFPGCTHLMGNVTIQGDDITNLNGLNAATIIEGDLIIGHHDLGGNPNLINLVGLDNVSSIGGYLTIRNNPALSSITGLEGLTIIGGGLSFWNNDALTSLTGLQNVTSIGGYLKIRKNDNLTSLIGLDNIEANTISYLNISINPYLSTCHVQSICDYLASPNGEIEIDDNAPGCNSIEEVQDSCEAHSGIYEVLSIPNELHIYPNPTSGALHLQYKVSETRNSKLALYSLQGVNVRTLLNEVQRPGEYELTIDISDLPSGMYFCTFEMNNPRSSGQIKKIVKL